MRNEVLSMFTSCCHCNPIASTSQTWFTELSPASLPPCHFVQTGGYWCLSTQSFSQGSQTRPGLQPPFAAITPPGGEHYYPNSRRKSVSSLGRKLLTFRMETSSRKSRPILCVLNAFCGFLLCRLLCVLGRTMLAVPAPLAIAEASTRRQLWNIRWKYGWKHEENPWMMCNVYMTCRQLLEKNGVFLRYYVFKTLNKATSNLMRQCCRQFRSNNYQLRSRAALFANIKTWLFFLTISRNMNLRLQCLNIPEANMLRPLCLVKIWQILGWGYFVVNVVNL